MRIQSVVMLVALVSAAGAQGVDLPAAERQLAQNTAAPDRGAAGNGSMGIGEDIQYLDEQDRQGQPVTNEAQDARSGRVERDAEPGHGGNETDMEHRRRPTLDRREN